MAIIYTKCPHCSYNIRSRTDSEKDFEYGSPICVCPKCKQPYYDSYYKEIELEGIKPSSLWVLEPIAIKSGIGFIAFAILVFVLQISFFIVPMVASLIYPAYDLITYKKRKRDLDYEAELSKRRLSDKDYAATLKRFGCNVPREYLE